MKKILGLILIIAALGFMTGCSTTEAADNGNNKQYTIGIAQFGGHGSLENCKEGFIAGLAEEGIIEGENLTIIEGNAQFDTNLSYQIAQGFVSKNVDLIAAIATPMAQSSFNAARNTDIPVVYTAVTDPEAALLTDGNITGTSDRLPVEAQLKLMREMLPDARSIGILYTTSEVNSISSIEEYKRLSSQYGFEIIDIGISVLTDIPLALDKLLPQVDAITNLTDNMVVSSLPLILSKANEMNIPVFGSEIEQVEMGCVASAGLEYVELGKQTGRMAAAILKGEKRAAEMSYEIVDESRIYINSEVMDKLGLTLSQDYMDKALKIIAN